MCIRDSKNSVDVIFVAGSAIGQAVGDAVKAAAQNGVAPTFVEIDQADGIAKRNTAFDSVEIDAGTFGGVPPTPDDKLTSLSFPEYLVARKSFGHSSIADLAKLIYTSRLAIAAQMGGEVKIEAPSTDKDADTSVSYTHLDVYKRQVYDPVGGPYAEPAVRSLAWLGRYLVVGFAAGEIPKLPLNLVLLRSCDIRGVFWGAWLKREPQAQRAIMTDIVTWCAEGKLSAHVHAVYPLAEIATALKAISDRKVMGKILLRP